MFSRLNRTDSEYEVADFLEYECLKNGIGVSAMSYRSLLSISDDEINNEGIESSDDFSVHKLDEAIAECQRRERHCSGNYPFIPRHGALELRPDAVWHKDIYTFLLFATRLDMQSERMQDGHDGTKLFEFLCAKVAKEYYGSHCNSEVFGTASEGSFHDKVEALIGKLHISGQFKAPEGSTGRQKDGNLDIVSWIPFADKKDGQLIALGQCKTGTSWDGTLTELNPDNFFSCYSTQQPYSLALKMFFVAESFGNYKWEERCTDGGILFDRTRIMEYLPSSLDEQLLGNIRAWNAAALASEIQKEDEL